MNRRPSLPTDPVRRRRLAVWAAGGLVLIALAAVVGWLVVWPALELDAAERALLGAQQGDFAGEEDRLRSAVDRNHPDAVVILEALAKGYDAAYRWPDAVAALGKLLELDPDHVPARLLRGTIADRLRRPEPAEEDFRRAVDLAPESAAAHVALAGLLTHRGQTREAIAHYELALRSRPADPVARIGLARALADNADPAGAERQLDEVLA